MACLRICLVLGLAFIARSAGTPVLPMDSTQDDAGAPLNAYWSIAGGLCLVAIIAMCAHSGDPQQPSSQPDGAIATVEPSFMDGPLNRARIATPAKGPSAPSADYGEVLHRSAGPVLPTPVGDAQPAYIRDIVDGQLAYREVPLDQVDALIAQGQQVFRPSNRQDAGQDIYESVNTSTDLYASVTPKGGGTASAPSMDLYAAPMKPAPAASTVSATMPSPAATVPNDYDGPVYATPNNALPSLAPPPGSAPRHGYVNQAEVDKAQAAIAAAREDAMAAEGSYVPQALHPPAVSQLLYEPVDEPAFVEKLPADDLAQWMSIALTREQAAVLLSGKPAGTFIVRKSIKDGSFVLSMAGKMTYNFKIVEKALMFLILDDKNKNQPEFHSVPDLLEHFKRIDPNASGGLPVRLTNVLPFSAYSR